LEVAVAWPKSAPYFKLGGFCDRKRDPGEIKRYEVEEYSSARADETKPVAGRSAHDWFYAGCPGCKNRGNAETGGIVLKSEEVLAKSSQKSHQA
jgi:hypothetical protein